MSKLLLELYSEEIPALLQSAIATKWRESLLNAYKKYDQVSKVELDVYTTPVRMTAVISHANSMPNDDILSTIITQAIKNTEGAMTRRLLWPNSQFKWIRPIKNISIVTDSSEKVLPILHLVSNNKIFINKSEYENISNINDYFNVIKGNNIILNQQERKSMIQDAISSISQKYNIISCANDALIDEITGIVEQSYFIEAELPEKFDILPKELICLVLEKNQKYIMFEHENKKLSRQLLIVANGDKDNHQIVKDGNLKVINARLSDALFYYQKDCSLSCDVLYDNLRKVNFCNQLNYIDYINFQHKLLERCNVDDFTGQRVKWLINNAKLELATNMISEFPELTGIIGSYYIRNIWKNDIYGLEDVLLIHNRRVSREKTYTEEARVFICVDRLSYIIIMYQNGNKPTSSGDPYAVKTKIDDLINLECAFDLALFGEYSEIHDIKVLILKRFENIMIKKLTATSKEELEANKILLSNFCALRLKNGFDSIRNLIQEWNSIIYNLHNTLFKKTYTRIIGLRADCEIIALNTLQTEILEVQNIEYFLQKVDHYLDTTTIIDKNEQVKTQQNLSFIKKIFERLDAIVDHRVLI